MACGCAYESGAGSRMWATSVASCANAPFSTGSTFAPVFTGYNVDHVDYVCGLESFNLTYGSEIQEIFVAALAGAGGTVEGVKRGSGEIVVIHDSNAPIGDLIQSGTLYDFVVTLNSTNPTGTDASDKVVGRFRAGQLQLPFNLNGEVIRITIPFITDGLLYGDLIAQPIL